MSLETATERKRKRIIEHTVGPFDNAWEAIRFGNTVESLVNERLGKTKFRQSIGSDETALAITEKYIGRTMLQTVFLEIQETAGAQYICDQLRQALRIHNEVYSGQVEVLTELIRDKPQPQYVGG